VPRSSESAPCSPTRSSAAPTQPWLACRLANASDAATPEGFLSALRQSLNSTLKGPCASGTPALPRWRPPACAQREDAERGTRAGRGLGNSCNLHFRLPITSPTPLRGGAGGAAGFSERYFAAHRAVCGRLGGALHVLWGLALVLAIATHALSLLLPLLRSRFAPPAQEPPSPPRAPPRIDAHLGSFPTADAPAPARESAPARPLSHAAVALEVPPRPARARAGVKVQASSTVGAERAAAGAVQAHAHSQPAGMG